MADEEKTATVTAPSDVCELHVDLASKGGSSISKWERQNDGTYQLTSTEFVPEGGTEQEARESLEAFGRDLSSP